MPPNPIKITPIAEVPSQPTVMPSPSVKNPKPALISSRVPKFLTKPEKKESSPNYTFKPTNPNQIISSVKTNNQAL